tara:strand:- start:337 stop:1410 length:1074 start_codon:yes stop_codon:yes gene_type:complete
MSSDKIVVGLLGDNKPYMFKNSAGIIDGLDHEIWKTIESEQDFQCEYKYVETPNYDEEIKKLADGEYDVLVGNISITHPRANDVTFSSLSYLDQNRLVYKHSDSDVYFRYLGAFASRGLVPFAIIIFFGLILGYFLLLNRKKGSYMNVFYNTIISLLGEYQNLGTKTRSNYVEFFISFMILIISFYFTMFLQGATTTDIIRIESENDPFSDVSDLANKNILTIKGTSQSSFMKYYETKVKLDVTDIDYDDLPDEVKNNAEEGNIVSGGIADYYLKNAEEFDGMFVSEESFKQVENKYPDLRISSFNMGYDEIAIAINKNNTDLLRKINISLASMKDNKLLPNICEKYFLGDNTKCIL